MTATIGWTDDWWDVLGATFMQHALVAGSMTAIAAAAIGYFVVIRRDAFAAHALAHIGFPGATGAVLVGTSVTLGLAVFCAAGAIAIGALGRRVDRREVATGTVLSLATALGVLFASATTKSSTTVTNVLFGNLLAVSSDDLLTFGSLTALALIVLAVVARPLLFASVTPQVAEAQGLPVRVLGIVFLLLLALVVTMAVQVVGTLLLFALVVTPAATALTLTARPAAVVSSAGALSLGAVWGGLVLSAMFNLPPSFPIVALAVAAWGIALAVTRPRRRRPAGVVADHHHDHGHAHDQ